ncbi:MAG: hypothetical protein A2Z72_00260 [Omnitrophica bacterium RBG_13_46_9]|nr:MAG: hypothetical protein A2Z72_00260 [Omnitrophica bacterium RBG_13_46_9]
MTELCEVLGSGQSNLSKHLARLRLTGVVSDRRQGLKAYYYLCKPENKAQKELINAITVGLSDLKTFKIDIAKLKKKKLEKADRV